METKDKTATSEQSEAKSEGRRSFLKAAIGGAAAAGVVATVSKAAAAPAATCGAANQVPRAIVKAQVLFNNDYNVTLQEIIDHIHTVFDGSVCSACGMGGWPGPRDPGTVIELQLARAFLPKDQKSAVIYTGAGEV